MRDPARLPPALLAIAAIVLAQHGALLGLRDLWWSDEVRHAGVLMDLLQGGDWVALHLNGAFYPDKPPLYFWAIAGIVWLTGSTAPWVMFASLALGVFALLVALHRFARAITGDAATALTSVAVLASCTYFIFLGRYARMDFLFAALICLSWMWFFRAATSPAPDRRAVLAGFALAIVAAFVKGPFGLTMPLLAYAGMLAWEGRLSRLLDRSMLIGGVLVLAAVALWASALVASVGADSLWALIDSQIVGRTTTEARGQGLGYLRYAVTLPLTFLPWTLIAIFRRAPRFGTSAPHSATAHLAIIAGTALLQLVVVGEKHDYYLLPVMVPLSVLAAGMLTALSDRQARRFFDLSGGLLILTGLVLALAHPIMTTLAIDPGDFSPAIAASRLPGTGLALAGAALVAIRRGAGRGGLLAALLSIQTLFGNALSLAVAPTLDPVLSPRAIATLMLPLIADGHAPAVAHGIGGVFAYHLQSHYTALQSSQGVAAFLAENPRAVVAAEAGFWTPLAGQMPQVEVVGCARLAGVGFVVLATPPRPGTAAPPCQP